jgi:Cdc6-like AAA superfamily ATPase
MSRILYIGRSGTGKTTLMVKKLKEWFKETKKKNTELIVISPTAPLQEIYKGISKRITKYFSDIDEGVTNQIYELCLKNAKKKTKQKEIVIIIDDLGESNFMKRCTKQNELNHLIVTARHMKVNLVFLFQRMKQATNSLRDNCDVIYLFKVEDVDQKKNFKNAFCGELTVNQFDRLTEEAWREPYGYLKIDRREAHDVKYYLNETETYPQGNKF